jgi:toxin YoeB
VRSLEFDEAALEDLAWWIKQDRSKALRIVDLIKDVQVIRLGELGSQSP